jgi:hypothetical protein
MLFWRKGADSPKVRALVEILLTQRRTESPKRQNRV